MTPEISRRCPACGASVREADAMFCPECGKALSNRAQDTASEAEDSASVATEPAAVENFNVSESTEQATEVRTEAHPDAAPVENSALNESVSEQEPGVATEGEAAKPAPAERKSAAGNPRRIAGRTRDTLHRASTAARGVIEDEVKRVERIRTVSTTVIEEASYDPSLRFVLVAVGLFVVFIILLVLSKVMG